MKGRQLTLEEVLKLPLNSRVWYEEFDYVKDFYSYNSPLHGIVYFCGNHIADSTHQSTMLKYKDIGKCFEDGLIYEWIENTSNPMFIFEEDDDSNTTKDMATEICNLRGIDLTEDNIDKIMKEFK